MGWPHEQLMSGIFSIASHWVLQYLPEVVVQEQIGCAHFTAVLLVSVGGVITCLLLRSGRVIRGISIGVAGCEFCPIRNSFDRRVEQSEEKYKRPAGRKVEPDEETWSERRRSSRLRGNPRAQPPCAIRREELVGRAPARRLATTEAGGRVIRGSWLQRRIRRSRRRRR
jgi:hypothetical protein